MSVIPTPNVPFAPGVPPLPGGGLTTEIAILSADAVSAISSLLGPTWGIFQNGNPILVSAPNSIFGAISAALQTVSSLISPFGLGASSLGIGGITIPVYVADSIVGFDYRQDWRVSTYPVENGGFQSYDKVQLPFDIRLRVSAGGDVTRRQALLLAVDTIANSLALVDIVTPEVTLTSCNCTHYNYSRTNTNGVGLLIVDMFFTEVRVTSTVQQGISNPVNPASSDSQGQGSVSLSPASPSTQSSVSNSFNNTNLSTPPNVNPTPN